MIDAGVITTAKHWIAYEQDTFRYGYKLMQADCLTDSHTSDPFNSTESYSVFPANVQTPISSNVDDTATHELYMWGFAEAIRAGTGFIMW
jgi:beta-glucosidase